MFHLKVLPSAHAVKRNCEIYDTPEPKQMDAVSRNGKSTDFKRSPTDFTEPLHKTRR